jgi:transcriptional antiterminator RfaH
MWAIAQTKPKQEHRAEINLSNQGFRCYLPVIERQKFQRNAWVSCKEVYFSNYIFIFLDLENSNLSRINNTFGVSRLLVNKDLSIPYLLNQDYIDLLKDNIDSKGLEINGITKGSKVSITSGKLSNFTAIFLEKSGEARSKVLISLLNNEYITTVDSNAIERVF